ncbi:hypothetical protein E2562_031758 [Oryza meyeriana var. granulata]|uniref:Uncharacterized protein n=1 Tax=Oryza meyeriana var. granulata TaxID=110450 RepID=A0A6G1CVG7_9ORYZ|nr:hypothetical protein E2562_031758 [Oryza meyeriana var. granulata]
MATYHFSLQQPVEDTSFRGLRPFQTGIRGPLRLAVFFSVATAAGRSRTPSRTFPTGRDVPLEASEPSPPMAPFPSRSPFPPLASPPPPIGALTDKTAPPTAFGRRRRLLRFPIEGFRASSGEEEEGAR